MSFLMNEKGFLTYYKQKREEKNCSTRFSNREK